MILWFLLAILLSSTVAEAAVQNCTIAWNARTEADLSHYFVRWGTSTQPVAGTYPNNINVGNVTSRTCAQLGITTTGTKYARVAAVDTSGNVSTNSSEVSFTLNNVIAPSTDPTISGFSPTSGAPGTSVVITGTNFSSTLASNVVKFNGTTATVSSGNTTQLTATVPAAATTGTISVTVGAATGTSSTSFTVSAPPSSTIYTASTDFSNVQGPVWYYLNGDGTQMATYLASCTSTSGPCWQGANTYLTISAGGAHPGDVSFPSTATPIRRWVAPSSGTIDISGTSADEFTNIGDGVTFFITHNTSTTLYTRTVPSGGGSVAYSVTGLVVTAGDFIDFRVDPLTSDAWDGLLYTATIAFNATPPPPPPPPTPPPPPPPTIGLSAMTVGAATFNVGSTAIVTLTLNTASTSAVDITVTSADPTVLSAPTIVTVPANSLTANFTVLGVAAGSTQLTATLGTVNKFLTFTITPTATLTPATLLAPADHATLPSSTKFVILRWSEIRGATSYAVRVVDDTVSAANTSLVCPSTVFCVLDLHATSAAVTLKPGRTYTWTVTWTDASGTTSTPAARTFTVDLNE